MDRLAIRRVWAAASMLAAVLAAQTAQAIEQKPIGSWTIESAAPAPWADPAHLAAPEEPKRLIGKTVTFGQKAVKGPAPIGCAKPVYAMRNDGPDMLFQGALAEPGKDGKPRDAAALARQLGMTAPTALTYEIGCSEIEFHALTPGALVFGLNDRVYIMRPSGAPKSAAPAGSPQ